MTSASTCHSPRVSPAAADSLMTSTGDTGTGPRFGRAPGYPAFLALFPMPARPESAPAIIKIVQSALGAIGILLIASTARRAAGERAGVIAAWIATVYPPLVWMPSYVLSEALYLPLALGCTLLLTVAGTTLPSDIRRSAAAGLIAGAATLVRPGMLIFLPMAALWLAGRRQLATALAFTLAATVVIAPWTVRNVRHYGRFVLIASEGGVTFWTGNHPRARGEGDLAANPELKREEIVFRAAHPGLSAEELEPLYYRDALQTHQKQSGRLDRTPHPEGVLYDRSDRPLVYATLDEVPARERRAVRAAGAAGYCRFHRDPAFRTTP